MEGIKASGQPQRMIDDHGRIRENPKWFVGVTNPRMAWGIASELWGVCVCVCVCVYSYIPIYACVFTSTLFKYLLSIYEVLNALC